MLHSLKNDLVFDFMFALRKVAESPAGDSARENKALITYKVHSYNCNKILHKKIKDLEFINSKKSMDLLLNELLNESVFKGIVSGGEFPPIYDKPANLIYSFFNEQFLSKSELRYWRLKNDGVASDINKIKKSTYGRDFYKFLKSKKNDFILKFN